MARYDPQILCTAYITTVHVILFAEWEYTVLVTRCSNTYYNSNPAGPLDKQVKLLSHSVYISTKYSIIEFGNSGSRRKMYIVQYMTSCSTLVYYPSLLLFFSPTCYPALLYSAILLSCHPGLAICPALLCQLTRSCLPSIAILLFWPSLLYYCSAILAYSLLSCSLMIVLCAGCRTAAQSPCPSSPTSAILQYYPAILLPAILLSCYTALV